ncbi:MAG: hypothetical protein MZU79_05810 [Anaerotruncus sp.]|nr:hypothetical protein [Anaerotruncus sp.]
MTNPKAGPAHDVCQQTEARCCPNRAPATPGTLDPMATGLMVVCVGEATKFVKYLSSDDKTYEAEITFGIATNTQDITGEIVQYRAIPSALTDRTRDGRRPRARFVGAIRQVPPAFSAVKIDGKKL